MTCLISSSQDSWARFTPQLRLMSHLIMQLFSSRLIQMWKKIANELDLVFKRYLFFDMRTSDLQ